MEKKIVGTKVVKVTNYVLLHLGPVYDSVWPSGNELKFS